MQKGRKLYEGKSKIVYATDNPDFIIQYFKDDATSFNAAKRGTINNKGIVNNKISAKVFEFLEVNSIPTHFERILGDREMLIKKVDIVPLEVVVRNRAAGSLCRNLGVEEGAELYCPILEFFYKRDDLNDPLLNENHIRALRLAQDDELEKIKYYAHRINELMLDFFAGLNLDLIDFKMEFGRFQGKIILADELSQDTCRLWEMGTGKKMDKDRFRHDLGQVEEAYQEVLRRVSQK
jgi:phosphoribosylaminoimidazole-succinocarboxamide synthase